MQKAYAESLHESYRKLLNAVGAPRANEWLENELQELQNDMKILREERKKYMENIAGVLGVQPLTSYLYVVRQWVNLLLYKSSISYSRLISIISSDNLALYCTPNALSVVGSHSLR